MEVNELTLGQPVTFTHPLFRVTLPRAKRRWVRGSFVIPAAPMSGVVVGWRTLSDGVIESHGYYEPSEWRPTRYFKAYLVAYDMRANPIYVLRDTITPTEEP